MLKEKFRKIWRLTPMLRIILFQFTMYFSRTILNNQQLIKYVLYGSNIKYKVSSKLCGRTASRQGMTQVDITQITQRDITGNMKEEF